MKKFVLLVSILLVICFSTQILFASNFKVKELNTTEGKPTYVKGEIIVKFKTIHSRKRIREMFGENIEISNTYSNVNIKKINIPDNMDENETLEIFRNNPSVEYAHLNSICYAFYVPNDIYYSYQWNFKHINMEKAWDIQKKGSGDIIGAVIDTGIAYENYNGYEKPLDLSSKIFCYPYDFINNDDHANDDEGHGTHVTGTICQTTNNLWGVAGIAYGTSIMPVKVLDSNGCGTDLSTANGIIWAVDHGARIINMSLGFKTDQTSDIPQTTNAMKYAYDHEVIMVAASGNDGIEGVSYPAAYPEVIAVGAINYLDDLTNYSQYGINQELVAPGGDSHDYNLDGYVDGIPQETFKKPNYDKFDFYFFTGTSMAAPHVTGLISLLLSQQPSRTIIDIRNILHKTSKDLGSSGWDKYYGYGRIDAYNALNYDKDGDGFSIDEDCDDNNKNINPNSTEICNGVDDNCDGLMLIDEIDSDNDGFMICNGDCDDTDINTYPGSLETCDNKDNDCDGSIDEELTQTCITTCGDGTETCVEGEWVNCTAPNPSEEICDDIDNNCNGQIDEGVKNLYYKDQDNDGYGNSNNTIQTCSAPSGYVSDNTDCNDNDSNINPGMSEICDDGIDNNCDGIIDCPENNDSDDGNCFVQSL